MIDPAFYDVSDPVTAEEVASLTGAELHQSVAVSISTVAEISASDLAGALVYLEHKNYLPQLEGKNCTAILTTTELADRVKPDGECAVLVHKAPKVAFALTAARLVRSRMEHNGLTARPVDDLPPGSDPTALIDKTAMIADTARIGAHTVIGPGVEIGARSYIGPNATISHARIGEDCFVSAGAVIGEAGFGVAVGETGPVRVPQLGAVLIADHVSVGANTAIDRGGLSNTVIGEGTQIDNLVQIAHNVKIGRNCLLASHVGISGSCEIGDNVMMGGQVGISDHVKIGDNVILTGRAGVMKEVPANEKWGGFPARPASEWMREMATLSRLVKQKRNKT